MGKRKNTASTEPEEAGGKGPKRPHAASDEDTDGHQSDASSSTQKSGCVADVELSMEVMQEIASFYETNPMFYDCSHINFKNTKLKEKKVAELAAKIDVTGEFKFNTN